MKNLKSERLACTSVRKECLPSKFMKTSWKTLGKESLSYSTVKKWAAELKRVGKSVEDDRRSGCPKDVTADENVKVEIAEQTMEAPWPQYFVIVNG